MAIGSKLGKSFACCYMRKWGEALLEARYTLFYKRLIGDVFGVWTGSEAELREFAVYVNAIHDSIKEELRYERKQIEFLDYLVEIEDGHLHTDLFIKPTDNCI